MKPMSFTPIEEWNIPRLAGPLIISGPCSAESEEQVLETARGIAGLGVHIFRAGIWKPRTRPGSFEGVGSVGLNWLRKVRQETGLPTATEVANVKHVYEALRAGVDVIWVGARTSVNPFAIQEIADALRGVDIPVLVKNPVNPDLDLWMGAIERFHEAGIRKLAALHRGFCGLEQSPLRNEPYWHLVIELRRRIPRIPLICDPSHIAGRRDMIPELAQHAMRLDYQGLMVEAHRRPDEALSDAQQQLTFDELKNLLDSLVVLHSDIEDRDVKLKIQEMRSEIDQIDLALTRNLGKRMAVARRIGGLKKEHNIALFQSERWSEIVDRSHERARREQLDEGFIDDIFRTIHQESIRQQERS